MSGSALREVFARFGVAFDTAPLTAGNAAVSDLSAALGGLGQIVAGAAIVQGIRGLTSDVAAIGTELRNSSLSLGLSTDALQGWRAAAAGAGVSAEQLTPAIGSLRRNAAAAALGAAGMRMDFRRLGVSLRDENGHLRTTDDLLQRTIEGLAGVEDPTRRAGIATRLLGESGARLGPLFANGAAGVAEARAELERLGGGLSGETIEASAEFTAQTLALDHAFLSLRGRLALFFLPAMARTTEALSSAAGGLARLADRSHVLQAALVVLGGAAVAAGTNTAIAWVAAAAPFVVLGALVLGLILLIDDLWTGLAGGESVLLDLGRSWEEWAAGASGAIRPVVDAVDLFLASLREATGLAMELAGHVSGDSTLIREGAALQNEGIEATARAISARNAVDPANAAGALSGANPALDSIVAGLGGGGTRAPSGPVSIDRRVAVTVNANGLTAAEAESVATRAVSRALDRTSDDLADTLADGGA